jgi:hypothetical protein
MLIGKFGVLQELSVPATDDAIEDGYTLENDFYQNAPNLEMSAGLIWSMFFNEDKYRISLKGAYEVSQWWNQLNMRKFFTGGNLAGISGTPIIGYSGDTVSRGDLSLNGFSLRLQLDI